MSHKKQKVIVIGNGMVGHRFCERITELGGMESFEVTVFGEEKFPAYDRVHLSSFFQGKNFKTLFLTNKEWYQKNGLSLLTGKKINQINRNQKTIIVENGEEYSYDKIVIATGSRPFVPKVAGIEKKGVFVYRTIDDVQKIIKYTKKCRSAAILGGGVLGLEAAAAAQNIGLQTHIVEFAPRLLPLQLDDLGAELLVESIKKNGISVHLRKNITTILGNGSIEALGFNDGEILPIEMLIVSAGIRPRDELADEAGLEIGERGGVVVNDQMRSSDSNIYAIGEVSSHRNRTYGLVAPGYEMADVAAHDIMGKKRSFTGFEMSTKLKLIGIPTVSFGDAFGKSPDSKEIIYLNKSKSIYKKLVINSVSNKLIGGILVGDSADFGKLQLMMNNKIDLPEDTDSLLFSSRESGSLAEIELPDNAEICKCNGINKGDIIDKIHSAKNGDINEIKKITNAGTCCGGCIPALEDIISSQLKKNGVTVSADICEHFRYSRQELYDIIKENELKTFNEIIASRGTGSGCELCKPIIASLLSSIWNRLVVEQSAIQDTNDRYLANIQRGGSYSVIPRIPGGEITPEQLIKIGETAKKYDLYCKFTGAQRIGLFGARLEQLPDIWDELIAVGFESGHAYGKAIRTVKSCVGSTWCRFGVRDSTSLAIKIENRYKGIRASHKLKSAVSGCIRECAEAQSKDFGIIATEKGWNLYVCGNGGARPRHADLLASDLDETTLIQLIDRFIAYYIRTADKLTRTASWLNNMEGGIESLKKIIVDDSKGLAGGLEKDIRCLSDTYQCEWRAVVTDPEMRMRFRHFANSNEADESIRFVYERGQKRPVAWDEGVIKTKQ